MSSLQEHWLHRRGRNSTVIDLALATHGHAVQCGCPFDTTG
ncbi:hypothetical protein [Pseudomonas chlororaphis]|nr:hypothetical protein [Pseudomonas chlororaphis]